MNLFTKKKPAEAIPLETWVLARVNERHEPSYYAQTECHAGQIKFWDGNGTYAVRFQFGTRWIDTKHLRVVARDVAERVDPAGSLTLGTEQAFRLGKVRDA